MCLEESFCQFTRDALNFLQPKIYAAPPSSVQVSPLPQPSSLRRVTLRSIIQLPPMLTGVVSKSDSLPEFDSPRVNAHDVILCRQLRKQTGIRRRK